MAQDLDRELTERDLASISLHLVEWPDKARDLGLSEGEIDNIRSDYQSAREQKRAVLRRWRNLFPEQATLRELRRIAEQCGWGNDFLRHLCSNDGSLRSQDQLEALNIPGFSWAKYILVGIVIVVFVLISTKRIQMHLYRSFSSSFPFPRGNFVGRDDDVAKLIEVIDFHNRSYDIICIVGPPGIGKSTLAIHVGNEMIWRGAVVHYIDMAELPVRLLQQTMKQKLSNHISIGHNGLDFILNYFSRNYLNNLLVLDNCDECINSQRQSLQDDVTAILENFSNVKIMTTSREKTMYLEHYYVHELKPLSEDSACKLLDLLPMNLSESEKRSIANLTGEIPLALQIIGSLIEAQIYLLTPTKIINELGKNPISFLSPLYLTKTLNFSITLSYDHLDNKTKKVGKYLAYFPGSFDQTAALSILKYISTSGKEGDYYIGSIEELVARSLLELDTTTERYHFHRLIKEFFLDHSNPLEEKKFLTSFQKYFSDKLCSMTETFIVLSKTALTSLHRDQQNIRFFLDTIIHPVNHTSSYYAKAVHCFAWAVKMKFLSFFFTSEELVVPMQRASIIFYRELLGTKKAKWERVKTVSELFVELTINTASLLVKDDVNQAAQQYMNGLIVVEKFGKMNYQDPTLNKLYIYFYSSLLSYKIVLNETVIKLCHDRILSKVTESQGCTSCNSYDIGLAYYFFEKCEESVYFLEKVHGDSKFSVPVQVGSLLKCRKCYAVLQNSIKLEEVSEQLKSMFVPMMNQSLSLVYANEGAYSEYYRFLGLVSEKNKSASIIEKLIESFYELKVNETPDDASMQSSLIEVTTKQFDLSNQLFRDKEYNKAAKVVYHVVDLMNVARIIEIQDYQLTIQSYASLLAFHFDTREEAEKQSVKTVKFILARNLTSKSEFSTVCNRLILLGNFDYVRVCYFPDHSKVFKIIAAIAMKFPCTILRLEFHYEVIDTKPQEQPLEEYPQVIHYSQSTAIIPHNNDHTALAMEWQKLFSTLPSSSKITEAVLELLIYITSPIKVAMGMLFKYTFYNKYAVFLMNVIAVFIKITFVYYVPKYIFKCTQYYKCFVALLAASILSSMFQIALIYYLWHSYIARYIF